MTQDISLDLPYVGSRSFVRPNGVSFWEFLRSQDIAYRKQDFPFLSRSHIPQVKPVFDFDEYVSLSSRGEALSYLYQGLGRSLNYVGPVLDLELEHGFNDHTDRHTLWVSQTGVELLQRAGKSHSGDGYYDEQTEVLMTLVGMMHDLGNFMGRKNHSTYSAWLMSRLFDNVDKQRELWDKVLYTVLFHEEPVLLDLDIDLTGGMPLQWALIAADKMHVGRERIGGRSFSSGVENKAFEKDVHILINSLIVRSSWYVSANAFVWHLDFSIDTLQKKFAAFSKGSDRLWVTPQIQRNFLRQGKKYRESFTEMFSDIYIPRVRIAAEAIYLLFDHVDQFKVLLDDTDTRDKVGSGQIEVYTLERSE